MMEDCIMHQTAGSTNRADVAEDEDEEQGSLNWNFCSLADLLNSYAVYIKYKIIASYYSKFHRKL